MVGGFLIWTLSSLLVVAGIAVNGSQSGNSTTARSEGPSSPPPAPVKPVAEMFHGTRVVDNYRWLENSSSPETEKWVAGEMAYTRSILDPLPGREAIHKRLTELLSIGMVTPPQLAGRHYFYTKREGMQNQPVLYVRDSVDGPDRVLVDANQLASDGTVALDWFSPSETGKYVAYGTSPGGSEMSTLHVIETKTGNILPDTIERTRAASVAWLHDNSGFYYTQYPKKGEVPDGQEMYNRHVYFHLLGDDPEHDDLIFGEGRDPEDWPNVQLSDDGRWLLITVEQGWTKSELFLQDLKSDKPPSRMTTGKDFLYRADIYHGKVYITTNEDAPRYRVFVTDAGNFDREAWKEIIPQTDAVLQGAAVFGGRLFAQYEENATSQLKLFDLDGKKLSDVTLPALGSIYGTGGRWDRDEVFFGFQSFTIPPSIYRINLKSVPQGLKPASSADSGGAAESRAPIRPDSGDTTESGAVPKTNSGDTVEAIAPSKQTEGTGKGSPSAPDVQGVLWTKVEAPSIDPSAY